METSKNIQRDELAGHLVGADMVAAKGGGSRHWENMADALLDHLTVSYRDPGVPRGALTEAEAPERLSQVLAYVDRLESPETLEFESEEVRRVVRVIALKVRSLSTGEPEPKDELSPRVKALLQAMKDAPQ